MVISNHLYSLSSDEPIYTGLGRPGLGVSAFETNGLDGVYRSWKDVALHWGVSVKTLEDEMNLT